LRVLIDVTLAPGGLYLLDERSTLLARAAPSTLAYRGDHVRYLLIDDHPLFRGGLELLLESLDPRADVTQASSVDEAVSIARSPGRIDLAMIDLHMPGHTGLSSLRRFRDEAPHVPVVVLSGAEGEGVVRDAIDAGAMGFIPKASDPEALIDALNVVLHGGIYLPQVAPRADAKQHPDVAEPRQRLADLGITPRQIDVLGQLAQGKSNKVIARELGIADTTVKTHIMEVFGVLGVHSRTELLFELSRRGLSPLSWSDAEPAS
jgi:DNA-binding NarL/FixJ family response regulator